jgi:APA family basic amino acid/polyamine antiporter
VTKAVGNLEDAPPGAEKVRLPAVLGPWTAVCVLVGSVIGSGIFIVPASVARSLPAIGPIAGAWVLGGLFSLAGALTLSELAAMLPQAGGMYVYLREAYGRLPAFLFGWTELLIVRAGSMATLASAFALYFGRLWSPTGLSLPAQAGVAVGAMAIVAVVNVLGTRWGGGLQVVGTALKVGAIGSMIVLPFALGRADASRLAPVWPARWEPSMLPGFLAAMIGVLWTYDGWVNSAALAEEVRDPGRNMPRTIIGGVLILIALYLGTTLAYHLVLPMEEIASASVEKGSPRAVSADFLQRLLGRWGLTAIALVVMTSTFISLNGNVMAGPRAYFAQARDGLFPRWLCAVHPRFQTPAAAILVQSAWAIALTVLGTALVLAEPPRAGSVPGWVASAWGRLHETPLYDVLFTYVIFGATIFYMLSIASVFVLRARRPDLPRPYRTWGYPATPVVFLLGGCVLLAGMLMEKTFESLAGLGIIASGVPVYFLLRRR